MRLVTQQRFKGHLHVLLHDEVVSAHRRPGEDGRPNEDISDHTLLLGNSELMLNQYIYTNFVDYMREWSTLSYRDALVSEISLD